MQHNNYEQNIAFFPCLVPPEQIPVNEYRHLKESRFFRWVILKRCKYATKLLAVWISNLLLGLFIIAAKFVHYDITHSDFYISALAKLAVLLTLTQLYTAWNNIYSPLVNRGIDYKIYQSKTTQIWQKSKSMLVRDRLVARFQVCPILKRLKQLILLLLLFLSLDCLILFLTINH